MRIFAPLFLLVISIFTSCDPNISDAENLLEQSEASIAEEEYTQAIDYASQALELFSDLSDSSRMAESYYLMARASAFSGDFSKAEKYGESGSMLVKPLQKYSLEYKLNNVLSWAYFVLGKSFRETKDHNERQLLVVKELDNDEFKASVYNNYGYDATVAGLIPLSQAIEYSAYANDYYARTENTNGRWYTLMNLTWQHRLRGDFQNSEYYGNLSVKQAKEINDRHAIVEANTNLGETLLAQGKIEEAKPLYDSALRISQEKEDRDKYVFDVYYSRYLWETGDKVKAVNILKEAINFLEDGEIFYEMLGRAFLAQYSFSLDNPTEAELQVAKFKNPRASYFSQESETIATLIEAQLLSSSNKEEAIAVLDRMIEKVNISGAKLLNDKLTEMKNKL